MSGLDPSSRSWLSPRDLPRFSGDTLFDRVAHAYLIGEAADDFARVLDGHAPWTVSEVMEAAVADAAADAAAAGEPAVVLLSPACASFDQFPDFEVRGEAFRAAVLALGAIPPEDGA